MAEVERSLTEVLQDIVRNLQQIVRSEVELAKTEIRDEISKTKTSLALLAAGAVVGIFAFLFLLVTLVEALALVIPGWAAALIVGVVLAVIAAVLYSGGVKRFKQVHAKPERTVETIRENVEWARQQAK